jgi:hypothetical protein
MVVFVACGCSGGTDAVSARAAAVECDAPDWASTGGDWLYQTGSKAVVDCGMAGPHLEFPLDAAVHLSHVNGAVRLRNEFGCNYDFQPACGTASFHQAQSCMGVPGPRGGTTTEVIMDDVMTLDVAGIHLHATGTLGDCQLTVTGDLARH